MARALYRLTIVLSIRDGHVRLVTGSSTRAPVRAHRWTRPTHVLILIIIVVVVAWPEGPSELMHLLNLLTNII